MIKPLVLAAKRSTELGRLARAKNPIPFERQGFVRVVGKDAKVIGIYDGPSEFLLERALPTGPFSNETVIRHKFGQIHSTVELRNHPLFRYVRFRERPRARKTNLRRLTVILEPHKRGLYNQLGSHADVTLTQLPTIKSAKFKTTTTKTRDQEELTVKKGRKVIARVWRLKYTPEQARATTFITGRPAYPDGSFGIVLHPNHVEEILRELFTHGLPHGPEPRQLPGPSKNEKR